MRLFKIRGIRKIRGSSLLFAAKGLCRLGQDKDFDRGLPGGPGKPVQQELGSDRNLLDGFDMKYWMLAVVLGLCSCYRTDFSISGHTAQVSGKMAAIHSWYVTGEKHVFITKIDDHAVRGTRKLTVDAGRRTIEVAVTGFKVERGYTGGIAVITAVLQEGHVYQIASGSSETRDQVFLKDVTTGGRAVASAKITGR